MKSSNKNTLVKLIISFIIAIGILVGAPCSSAITQYAVPASAVTTDPIEVKENPVETRAVASLPEASQDSGMKTKLFVHFIDVGQADCILVQNGSESMLIDAGNNADSDIIIKYLNENKIKKLDYVVGTHPHEDHIGSLDSVINTFGIGKVYMPKVPTTTSTFKAVLTAIKNKGLKVTTPVVKSEFKLGTALCTILAPNGDIYEDLNNFSIVIKLTFGKTAFLFTGDAEAASEIQMLDKKLDLKADVIKVGHHGSNSSTSDKFLKAVSPKYAIISVGIDNDYGHPSKETLTKLTNKKVQIFRTDEEGTIIGASDGNTIKFYKNSSQVEIQTLIGDKTTVKPAQKDSSSDVAAVYITKTGKKYHLDGCEYLSKSKIPITLKDAKFKGYTACSKCNPPE